MKTYSCRNSSTNQSIYRTYYKPTSISTFSHLSSTYIFIQTESLLDFWVIILSYPERLIDPPKHRTIFVKDMFICINRCYLLPSAPVSPIRKHMGLVSVMLCPDVAQRNIYIYSTLIYAELTRGVWITKRVCGHGMAKWHERVLGDKPFLLNISGEGLGFDGMCIIYILSSAHVGFR